MSLSDCQKCWSTPCCCGYDYKNYPNDMLSSHIASITQYRTKEEAKQIILNAVEKVDKTEKWKEK